MSLEQQCWDRGIVWIEKIEHDPERRSVAVTFEGHAAVLTFTDVTDYSEEWHFPEDQARSIREGDDLIALDEHPKANGIEYLFVTDCRDIILFTATEPAWLE